MAAMNNPGFIHGNWNPVVRSSSNNIYLKGGKPHKNVSSSRCRSHEYPVIPAAHPDPVGFRDTRTYCNIGENFDDFRLLNIGSNNTFMGTRTGYQYRSNPQISFSNSLDNTTSTDNDFDTLSTTYDKSSCNPVRLAVSRNSNRNRRACEALNGHSNSGSGQQQIQKWKNELTAAASVLPRKWCDFVFRRNEDNRVYRSESFRFIQKTNSLALLAPLSASGGLRHRHKRNSLHGISVSDDYVDPVDHLLTSAGPQQHDNQSVLGAWPPSSTSGNTSSGSRRSGLTSSEEGTSTSTNLCGEDEGDGTDKEEPPYHEIAERYNAPYYYSDTIKEPTYISPCEDEGVQSPAASSLSNASSPSPVLSDPIEPVIVTIITTGIDELGEKVEDKITHRRLTGTRKHNKLNRRSAYLRGSSRELMARKRYETAFLPSSSPHASSQNTPDIDSLYLAVESSCHLGHGHVTKMDITQPKSSGHPCVQETDQQSSEPPTVKVTLSGELLSQKEQQIHGGIEQRIIYISHSPSNIIASPEVVESSSSSNQRGQLPLSTNPEPPACMSEGILISSNDLLPHARESYHRPSVLDSTEVCGSNASLQTNPSTSYCQSHHFQHHHHPHHLHQNLNINLVPSRSSGLCTTTNSSPLASHKVAAKPVMPLSEPLPQKRYITKSNSSSGHTTSSTSSAGNGETRRLGHNLKDNSVSSLESIDSTKSEELSSSLNRTSSHFPGTHHHHHHHHPGHYQPQKLLSPISDKSPLEPGAVLANSHPSDFESSNESNQNKGKWSNTMSLIDAAELTNVPWEMPKLRRKLAKFADSGISLDFAGSGSKETECVTASSMAGGRSSGSASLEASRGGGQYAVTTQGVHKREGAATSLQLSFDDGLTRDEYYEDPSLAYQEGEMATVYGPTRQGFLTASKIPGSAIIKDVTAAQVHVSSTQQPPARNPNRPDRCHMKLDFGGGFHRGLLLPNPANVIDPAIDLERQDWFHGAITRCEAENILRATKEGSFLVRNCESTTFNRYSLSLKSFRGCIHIRIEPNSLGTFSLGDQEFPSVPHLVLHFMSHRLPIKGAEHVRLMYPVITQLL